jgi:hypothetical protein
VFASKMVTLTPSSTAESVISVTIPVRVPVFEPGPQAIINIKKTSSIHFFTITVLMANLLKIDMIVMYKVIEACPRWQEVMSTFDLYQISFLDFYPFFYVLLISRILENSVFHKIPVSPL